MTDELEQNTEAWLQARAGSIGASDVPDIVRQTKSGYSATRANVMAAKTLERLTGVALEGYQSAAMRAGKEREPEARDAYEIAFDVTVERVGLFRHPLIEGSHASPDGLIGTRGLVEIKCPQPAAHLATLLSEKIESDYLLQMQWQMVCTGRQWCDFVSWNPDFPRHMQLWVKRVHRDADLLTELEGEVRKFLEELSAKVSILRARYELREAA